MKGTLGFHLVGLSLSSLVISCDRPARPAPDTPAVTTAEASTVTRPATNRSDSVSPCPRTGRWAVCSLEKRLEQSGFVLRKPEGEAPRRAGFTVQPRVYQLGRARLEVFLYPDETALAQDVAGMDTLAVAARGQTNDWEVPPRFIRSGNLIAVFLTRNEQQAERVTLAITAGPPQR
ncbi:MAG TPA: hypothetical protein VJZ25_02895 [Gemmatimonadaceae bacterium]|nr:hypothetical protein [Gemmatimonadaceae bacterium]